MSSTPSPSIVAALEPSLLDEIARLTQYPRALLREDWDLDDDLRLDWVAKGQLMEWLLRNVNVPMGTLAGRRFHFDALHTVGDLLRLLTGGPTLNPSPASLPPGLPFPVVHVAGSPFEMGRLHGESQGLAILRVMRRLAEIIGPRLETLPELEDVLAQRDRYFSPTEQEELAGLADALGVPIRHLIGLNVGLYPEYLPGCTQFAVTGRRNGNTRLVHGVNEDSPVVLMLREDLTRMVHVRRPVGGLPCLTFSIVGQIGGLNGLNAAGIAVSSTILLDCPMRQETRYGCVHPILVTRILEQADSIEAALEIVRNAERAGAWSLCISHAASDQLCYLEYDGPRLAVQTDLETVASSNHCLLLKPVAPVPEHSQHRLKRLTDLLKWNHRRQLTAASARSVLRDRFDPSRGRETRFPTMSTLRRVDNQGSLVMQPARGELWITPGPMGKEEDADRYYRLDVAKWLS